MYKLIITLVPYSVLRLQTTAGGTTGRRRARWPCSGHSGGGRCQTGGDKRPGERQRHAGWWQRSGVSGQRENLLSAGCLVVNGRSQTCKDSMDVDIQRLTGGRCRVSVLGRGLVSEVIRFAPCAVLSMLDCVPVKPDTASLNVSG